MFRSVPCFFLVVNEKHRYFLICNKLRREIGCICVALNSVNNAWPYSVFYFKNKHLDIVSKAIAVHFSAVHCQTLALKCPTLAYRLNSAGGSFFFEFLLANTVRGSPFCRRRRLLLQVVPCLETLRRHWRFG